MPYFVYLENGVAVDDDELTEEEAILAAAEMMAEWLERYVSQPDDPANTVAFLVEKE